MATVDVDCSECGAILQVDESLMGSTMTCPKCKLAFFVEPAGGYGLVEAPPRTLSRSPRPPSPTGASAERPETEEERRIRERMERWAEAEDS